MDALQSALDMLSASQPALRTVFFERDHLLFQHVKTSLPIRLEATEGKGIETDEWLLREEFQTRPFDLEKGPLIRCGVINQAQNEHILRILIHHIVSDAYSLALVVKEISRFYNAFRSDRAVALDINGNGLAEHSVREREWLAGEEGKAGMEYWMGRLDLGGMGHPWPTAGLQRPVSSNRNSPAGLFDVELGPELSRRIRSFAGRRGSTVFRFILGSYFLTLQGFLPARAVTVAMPVNLRRTEEEFRLVGCMISSLPVTMAMSQSESIEEYLDQVEWTMGEAFRFVRIPGPLAIDEWRSRRGVKPNLGQNTFFNFSKTGPVPLELEGTTSERINFRKLFSAADLDVDLIDDISNGRDSGLGLFLNFNEASLSRAQVETIVDAWVSVMRHATEGEVEALNGTEEPTWTVYAFPGGSGGFDEHSRFHRMGELWGRDLRIRVMPDPESSFGRLPVKAVSELAKVHAERIKQVSESGKTWLLGTGLGAVDAFAVGCELQGTGVREVGLILVDPPSLTRAGSRSQSESKSVDSYERMPDRMTRLKERIFDLRLRSATRGAFRYMDHPVPRSKAQVYHAACAYGLFDPLVYGRRYGCATISGEEMFEEYLREGWKSGRLPSEGFHAHRYREVAEGFVPGSDEPVLHALLFGMGKGEVRRRIVSMSREPLGLPDVVSARAFLRMEDYAPGMFRGEVHLVMTGETDGSDAQKSWQALVDGEVYMHQADVAPDMGTESVAWEIKRCLSA